MTNKQQKQIHQLKIYLVVKEIFPTRFAQDADLFEKNKFKGHVLSIKVTLKEGFGEPSPEALLAALQGKQHDDKEVVGVMVPQSGYAFTKGHDVFSDGSSWMLVKDLAAVYQAI